MKPFRLEPIIAMVCITVLEVVALLKGIDGILLTNIIAVIAGLGGFWIGRQSATKSNVADGKVQP